MRQSNKKQVSQEDTSYSIIEVFKTNVMDGKQAEKIIRRLNVFFPKHKINFDLEDCDNILRVESVRGGIESQEIIKAVEHLNYTIEILE
ncbi:hypothetical protein CLV98_105236 [Dyadobacter jejuensis]|uniref:Copper chaperone CopZ n=1 Tax=Dyadobacter jejuensis TaxID=1082580 RepID=A0A316ALW3_9BACT|nr:hypothetical protein [Dyadobacter jejuensis]PWJ58054.1 hypothetical protein CLV98_105236 [Dyadobacter jejuensis]